MPVIDCAYHFEAVYGHILVNQFQWFCKMIAVCYHHARIIFFYGDDNRLCIGKRVDIPAIDNCPDLQETQEYFVLSLDHDMVGCKDRPGFTGLKVAQKGSNSKQIYTVNTREVFLFQGLYDLYEFSRLE